MTILRSPTFTSHRPAFTGTDGGGPKRTGAACNGTLAAGGAADIDAIEMQVCTMPSDDTQVAPHFCASAAAMLTTRNPVAVNAAINNFIIFSSFNEARNVPTFLCKEQAETVDKSRKPVYFCLMEREAKTATEKFRLSIAEKAALRKAAKTAHMTTSAFLRMAMLTAIQAVVRAKARRT